MTALAAADRWAELLRGDAEGLTQRPAPQVWSPLEYGAHVRDVIRLFTERVAAIVSTDSPRFVGWDQEAAAVAARYDQMEPAIIAEEIAADTDRLVRIIDALEPEDWGRSGTRDGREFTVEFLLRYLLHDVEHHWYDVSEA
jgi:hypothetical protein